MIFTIDAAPLEHPELSQALPGGEEGEEALAMDGGALALDGGKSRWTARVSARSQVCPGKQVELAVDPASLYFFDPGSGRAIRAE